MDGAYCLFGIFAIFLPVIYGEGRESAFKRVEKEVADKSKKNGYHGKKGAWHALLTSVY
jgi:hypothetical protein